jgi:phenylalanyl-tRNA synthetase beta chain
MRAVLSWLQEFAPVDDDVVALAAALNSLGMAVDDVIVTGERVDGIVVARVLGLRRHPRADRIQLVDVDAGDGQPLQIACGAFNMAVGDLVPLATVGTVMPDGMEIGRRQMRGEWSNGMLCSPAELLLADEAGGIYILPPDLALGASLYDALGIRREVVFDLDLTRNRPDAYSHMGIARDLAAHLGVAFTPPSAPLRPTGDHQSVPVTIVDGDRCGRFTAAVISGVQIAPSPEWMARRLTNAGMRPINNVVDVSNYVMLELGRPNHTYDRARLAASGIRVRRALDQETIVTLDGTSRTLVADDLLICDGDDRPIGIAGVMGGADTEISDATTDVVLEMAYFEPGGIARTVSRLNLRSEASARNERGVDPYVTEVAVARFVELLGETCPELVLHDGVTDVTGVCLPDEYRAVRVRTARVNRMLGTRLTGSEIAGLLDPIGFAVGASVADGVHAVNLPPWRPDCETEIDVIEEIARHYGYDRIGKTVPSSSHPGALSPYQLDRRVVREVLLGVGCTEAMPNPFLAPGDLERCGLPPIGLRITNPLVAEESVLRTSLLPGLVKSVAFNASHRNLGVRLYELGHVYRPPLPGEPLPDEREMIGVVLAGHGATAAVNVWIELSAALAVDGVSIVAAPVPGLHASRSAYLRGPGGEEIGSVGEIDPFVLETHGITERVGWLETDLRVLLGLPHGVRTYRPVSRFPSSDIDLAFTLDDEVPAADLTARLSDVAGALLEELALFDVYRGPGIEAGQRSLAYRLRLRAPDHTLTDAEVAALRQTCIVAAEKLGARLRG